jgi:hypothetical protein
MFSRVATAGGVSNQLFISDHSSVNKVLLQPTALQLRSLLQALNQAALAARGMHPITFVGNSCKPAGPFDKVAVVAIDSFAHPEYLRNMQKAISARFHPTDEFSRYAAEAILTVFDDGSASDSLVVKSGEFNFDNVAVENALEESDLDKAYGPVPGLATSGTVRVDVVFGCRANLHSSNTSDGTR